MIKTPKIFPLLAALAIGASAHAQYASPELILVLDKGDGTAAHQAKIDRYDPFSGQYLGSFGQNFLNPGSVPYSVAGIQVIGSEVYVGLSVTSGGTQFSRIQKFNFSTGAFAGSISDSGPYALNGFSQFGNHLLASDRGPGGTAGLLWSYNSAGSASLLAQNSADYNFGVASDYASGTALVAAHNGLTRMRLNPDSTLVAGSTTVLSNLICTAVTTGTVGGMTSYFDNVVNIPGGTRFLERRNLAGFITGSVAPSQVVSYLATGHNGSVYALGSQGIEVFQNDQLFNYGSTGHFNTLQTYWSAGISVFAAPEPAPLALLGLGLLGIIAKRRKK